MDDKALYQTILGLAAPWSVVEVTLKPAEEVVEVSVESSQRQWPCPVCQTLCPQHDTRHRSWRHLDSCQYQTILCASIPWMRPGPIRARGSPRCSRCWFCDVHVADGRGKEAVTEYLSAFEDGERSSVKTVAMDMWQAYISAVEEWIPGAKRKICFDKFHVAQHLGNAGPCLGTQGELHERLDSARQEVGSCRLATLVQLGHPIALGTDQESRQDG